MLNQKYFLNTNYLFYKYFLYYKYGKLENCIVFFNLGSIEMLKVVITPMIRNSQLYKLQLGYNNNILI